MKQQRIFFFILIGLCLSLEVHAQKKNRIQPGKMYEAGETLFAPRFGFIGTVPEGWQGMLPRENEVFLLTSTSTSVFGEIYIFGRETATPAVMAEAWAKGFDLSETIKLKAVNPVIKDDILSSEVTAVGQYINKGNKAFAITRFSPHGPCVTILMVAPVQFYEPVKNIVLKFLSNSKFEPASSASPYSEFDWKEFLSNSTVATYASLEGGWKETSVNLCADGTFKANVKKGGFLKNVNPQYKGRLSGKWSVEGTGEKTLIKFTFDKESLAPMQAELTIKDEQVYCNGERYFVGKSDQCGVK